MYCKNCGNPISESTKFCANCGNQNEFFKDVSSEKEIVKDEGIENPIPKEDIYTSTIVNNIYDSETNKKGNKGLLITLIIIGSIIVIVALVFAFIKLFPSNTSTGVSSNNAEETSSYNNN